MPKARNGVAGAVVFCLIASFMPALPIGTAFSQSARHVLRYMGRLIMSGIARETVKEMQDGIAITRTTCADIARHTIGSTKKRLGESTLGREDNREHLLAYYRQYNAEHSEEHSAYNRSPARRQKQRAHQAANKERYQRAHREYAQSEHGRAVRASIQRRREAKKKGLQTGFTVAQWDYAVSYFDRCCAYCGEHTETLQQEHYIPIARGGGYVVDNIVPACKRCNVRKGVSLPAEWMAQQAFVAQGTAKRILTYFASLSHT